MAGQKYYKHMEVIATAVSVADIQFFLSILVVILTLLKIYSKLSELEGKIGELDGQVKILHEKVISLCKKLSRGRD